MRHETVFERQREPVKKLRIYLDTSVINFLFADDAPEKRDITREFFQSFVEPRVHEVWISDVVLDELRRTKDPRQRTLLLKTVQDYRLSILPQEPFAEIVTLAEAYVRDAVVPRKKREDALHIAICTVHEVDALVSWNFQHLANLNKERRVVMVNQANGYFYPLRITTPLEVMSYE